MGREVGEERVMEVKSEAGVHPEGLFYHFNDLNIIFSIIASH
jgi:hypothetical protein